MRPSCLLQSPSVVTLSTLDAPVHFQQSREHDPDQIRSGHFCAESPSNGSQQTESEKPGTTQRPVRPHLAKRPSIPSPIASPTILPTPPCPPLRSRTGLPEPTRHWWLPLPRWPHCPPSSTPSSPSFSIGLPSPLLQVSLIHLLHCPDLKGHPVHCTSSVNVGWMDRWTYYKLNSWPSPCS